MSGPGSFDGAMVPSHSIHAGCGFTISPSWISMTRSPGPDEAPVVGDDDQGAAELLLIGPEEREDLVARLAVEVAGGLVGEDDRRVLQERAGDRHALLLAAREARRLVAHPVAEPHLAQEGFGLRRSSGVIPTGMNGISTLSTAVRLGIRLNCWKMKPDLAAAEVVELGLAHGGQLPAVDGDRPRRRGVEGAQELEERGLARTRTGPR